ncbi:MAG TPA: hypothetical protein VJL10_03970 [Anaerolineales bacterium]|nr:hypothetical protein [Anaerolineales bacterium]
MKKYSHYVLMIFIIGLLFQLGLQWIMRPYAINGYLFQAWTSENFMQTVSIEDLRNAPLESLANIHIQPPGYDALRALLVQFWPSLEIHAALKQVDLSIYFLWSIAYSLGGVVIFLWLAEMTNVNFALASALLFLLHPAWIHYATFLDTTLPSSLMILWMFYLLWRIRMGEAPVRSLTLVVLLLFFVRSLFQLPFIPVIGLTLFLLKMPARKLVLFLVVISTVFGLYIFKQKRQFNLASTSSFTGINLTSSVTFTDYDHPYAFDMEEDTTGTLPSVLARTEKISGTINYNNYQYLYYNKRLTNKFVKFLEKFPVRKLTNNYLENLAIYFAPSSRYPTPHVIVDRLPWRNAYDWLFSAPVLPALLAGAGLIALAQIFKEKSFAAGLAMLLPAFYVFILCVLFEKGENNRYKFFLEPVYYVFIFSQFFNLYTGIRAGKLDAGKTNKPHSIRKADRIEQLST